MPLTMSQRKAVTRQVTGRYRHACKKDKAVILDEFCQLTGYNRSYASRMLRAGPAPPAKKKPKRRQSRLYDADIFPPLRKIWAILEGACGKRVAPVMERTLLALERHHELTLSPQVRAKLLSASASTIDRLLAPERAKLLFKGRSGTRPGLLRSQIPVRTFADWDDARPGFLEVDLVGHEGGNPSGDFCQTLDVTDVATGWTETRAVKNKARVWVMEALGAHLRSPALQDPRDRLGQRRRVHQPPPGRLLR